jgi:16S rRNA (guanine527-N7)-methyltransferase
MIEDLSEAAARPVSRETLEKLKEYAALLLEENKRQNLISDSSAASLWVRHILDSAQLVRYEPAGPCSWIDIGSGAGLPGIVIACIVDGPCALVEPRGLRADFLHRVVERLRLGTTVVQSKAERVVGTYDAITARAVTSIQRFLKISHHLSTGKTQWVLPKGRGALTELAEARRTWQGMFHVERSVTDPNSFIVVGTGVKAKSS